MGEITVNTFKLLVTGCRKGRSDTAARLDEFCARFGYPGSLVLGDAAGVDLEALVWARDNHVEYVVHRAEWKRFGAYAGPERNGRMVADCDQGDYALGLPGGTGTRNCLKQAVDARKFRRVLISVAVGEPLRQYEQEGATLRKQATEDRNNMSNPYAQADGLDPSVRDRLENLPAGVYPELQILKSYGWADPSNNATRYHRIDVKVLVAANGAQVGQVGSLFSQISGNTHDSYNREELGRVKLAVGCADGFHKQGPDGTYIADIARITTGIGGARLFETIQGEGRALAGKVIGAVITIKQKKGAPEGEGFLKYEAFPCVVNGQTKFVQLEGAAPATQAQNAPAPAAPAAPPPVGPAPVSAAPVVPPGWSVHPSDPKWIYELANSANMRPIG